MNTTPLSTEILSTIALALAFAYVVLGVLPS